MDAVVRACTTAMADELKGVPELCAHVLRSVDAQSWQAFSVARSALWLIAIALGRHLSGGVPRTERDPGFARLLQRFDEGEGPPLDDINARLCVGNSDLFEAEMNRRSWRILPNAREARRISKALENLESLVPHDDLPEPGLACNSAMGTMSWETRNGFMVSSGRG